MSTDAYEVNCDPATRLCTATLKVSTRRAYPVAAERARGIVAAGNIPALPTSIVRLRGEGAYLARALNIASRAVDEKRRTVTFVASTEATDRFGDIIRLDGWELENYKHNPVGLFAHDSSALPIARGLSIRVEREGLLWTAQFPTREEYEFADVVFRLIAGGFINAVSVGFIPIEFKFIEEGSGIEFLTQELLEISVVPVPANPEALVVGKGFEAALRAVEVEEPLAPTLTWEVAAEKKRWSRVAFRKWLRSHGFSAKLAPASVEEGYHVALQKGSQPKRLTLPPGIEADIEDLGNPQIEASGCACDADDEIVDLLLKAVGSDEDAEQDEIARLLTEVCQDPAESEFLDEFISEMEAD